MFCPECGLRCVTAVDRYSSCYQCPRCDTHWLYSEGSYQGYTNEWDCPNQDVQSHGRPRPK